ncbi:MAG: alpha-amylase family glycosyl hydrolase [Candidatus Xenobia bacterium]
MRGAFSTPEGVRFVPPAPLILSVEIEGRSYPPGLVREAGVGTRYRYRLNSGTWPDPYSRSQPEGPHAASEVVGTLAPLRPLHLDDVVLYEVHVGCATPEGTFDGLISRLDHLAALGVNALQIMPVAEFPGLRNWGYDGVDWFAASHLYGGVHGLRRLIEAAHVRGLAVVLDVVYNHFGPDGNYLGLYDGRYFTRDYHTPWGEAIDLTGPAREMILQNAAFWLDEVGVDGLRLDATHQMFDPGERHVLADLADLAGDRILVAEHEGDDASLFDRHGVGRVYADDFHHCLHVMLTGEREGYYQRYDGSMQSLVRCINSGWLAPGAEHVARPRFVYCLQNHDQVGNRGFGERLHHLPGVDVDRWMAASALLLLLPATPLLFMGQEWAASTPFQYFTDHHEPLGHMVTAGRRREFSQFAAFSGREIPDPQKEETFLRSSLDWTEREHEPHRTVLQQTRELLHLRRPWPGARARVLSADALAVEGDDRLLLVQFGDRRAERLDAAWRPVWEAPRATLYQR